MKRVITYGTFDLFHYGHFLLLKRAKALGDYLIVGISSDQFCTKKGKQTILPEELRVEMVKSLKFVDEVILEESMEQKVDDVLKYDVDIFVLGDDYKDVFPRMDEYSKVSQKTEVVFLARTPDISSSDLKAKLLKQMGMEKKY